MPPDEIQPVVPSTPAAPAGAPAIVPEPVAEPVAPTPAASEPAPQAEKWEASGDTLIDTIANGYIGKGGSVAQFQALLEDVGNTGTLTNAARVELTNAFGDMAPALIPAIEARAKANLDWVTSERNAVYKAAGSESEFTRMQTWPSTNLDEATRSFLTDGLNRGGAAAQLAVAQIKNLMIQKGETVTGQTHEVEGGPAPQQDNLTLASYLNEKNKLHRARDSEGVKALEARARTAIAAAAAKGLRWR